MALPTLDNDLGVLIRAYGVAEVLAAFCRYCHNSGLFVLFRRLNNVYEWLVIRDKPKPVISPDQPTVKGWGGLDKQYRDEYFTWVRMKNSHGARVCQPWRDSFLAFLADIGPRPTKGHKLYVPNMNAKVPVDKNNCVWIISEGRHGMIGRTCEIGGVTRSVEEWAALFNISNKRIRHRLELGWPLAKALATPVRHIKQGRH